MKRCIKHKINYNTHKDSGNDRFMIQLPFLKNYERGTAIVLVVVLLALLAIMGTSFIIMSRVEKVAAENQISGVDLDHVSDNIIEVIKATLSDDLWGVIDPAEAAKPNTDGTALKKQQLLGLPCDRFGNAPYNQNTFPALPQSVKNEPWDAPTGYNNNTAKYVYYDNLATPPTWNTVNVATDEDPWLASSSTSIGNPATPGSGSQMTNLFGSIPRKKFPLWIPLFMSVILQLLPLWVFQGKMLSWPIHAARTSS
jgi:hypothetical protein